MTTVMGERLDTKRVRIGIDLGGTKVEGIALDPSGAEILRLRVAAPRDDYRATIGAISGVVAHLAGEATNDTGRSSASAAQFSVGIGMPGSISPRTGRVQNANSTWLNGRTFQQDVEEALKRPVKLANDANCFAISEAIDGAGADAASVFGVIIGTGVGGGLVLSERIVNGPRGTGGEWGHNPLPWPRDDEIPGHQCWCGRRSCMETWVSGPALSADHRATSGQELMPELIASLAKAGNQEAMQSLDRHCDRLARGLAHVINIFDPDVVVLGGGLSNLQHLYAELPQRIAPYLFTDSQEVRVSPPRWGDSGGVRGAAWLWD